MNIVFLSMHPGFGGAVSANISICQMLSKKHNVFYIEEFTENIDCQFFRGYYNLSLIQLPLYANRYKPWKIWKEILKNKPDYILIGVPFVLIYYFIPLLFFRIKGGKIGMVFHSLGLQGCLKDKLIEFIISLFSMILDHLLFVSKYTKKTWSKYMFLRLSTAQKIVIYNSINVSNKVIHTYSKRISFIGRLNDEKQPELFCQLAKFMADKGYNYSFNIWGDGPLYDKLVYKYADYVSFRGFSSDIDSIYEQTDILLMTSKFENCPMVILEARAYGIPVIAPNVGGIPEIVHNGLDGLLYHKFDVGTLSNMVSQINENYRNYSINAYNVSKENSFEKISRKWLNIFND